MPGTGTDVEPPCDCKVSRVAAAQGLAGVHGELERRWGADSDASVRELAESFNRRVLRSGVERSGRTPLDGEIDNLYRLLTDDDVDAGNRTQAWERLRRDGSPSGSSRTGSSPTRRSTGTWSTVSASRATRPTRTRTRGSPRGGTGSARWRPAWPA